MAPAACTCGEDVLQCEPCRLAAADIAAAVAQICAHTRVNAVNEIEYTDPFTSRVATLRVDGGGRWSVIDVRPLGSAERGRCRPLTGRA
jgi:hypothetical protein